MSYSYIPHALSDYLPFLTANGLAVIILTVITLAAICWARVSIVDPLLNHFQRQNMLARNPRRRRAVKNTVKLEPEPFLPSIRRFS